jgi:outer membrane protein insertion porin family/translocation and assembly module TamA
VSAILTPLQRHLAILLVAGVATSASAFQDEGDVVVRDIQFQGVTSVSETRLRAALATRESSSLPWGDRYFFDRTRLEVDLKRIQAYYADRGFPDARVVSTDVQLNEDEDEVRVIIAVEEGEPVRIAGVHLAGFDVLEPDEQPPPASLPLEVGAPRDRQAVVEAVDQATNLLRDRGYPYAHVTSEEAPVESSRDIQITLRAEPGPLAYFGPVDIVGNTTVSARVIQRQLSFQPGDLYRSSLVQESQRRLYGLQLFQFVNVQQLDPNVPSEQVWMRVTVSERDHQRLDFGVGYGTEEKARVEGQYQHLNFFGGARTAGVQARWSSLDRGLRFQLEQPYLLSPHQSLLLDGQQWRTETPAYQSILTGGEATVTRRAGLYTSFAGSLSTEYSSSSVSADALNDPTLRDELIALGLDPTTGRQDGSLNTLIFDATRDTTDNPLDATRGYHLALRVERAGGWLPGTFNYTLLSGDAHHFLGIGERAIVATRLQLGSLGADDADPANVPFSKKYFLGGATSNRGWGRFEISPLSASGLPIGGTSVAAFTIELRLRIWSDVGGVAFLDAGNVWAENWTVRLDDLRYAIGLGFRYDTPVGPVRVDYGYQLNPIEGLLIDGEPQRRRWRLHFSIGQAF